MKKNLLLTLTSIILLSACSRGNASNSQSIAKSSLKGSFTNSYVKQMVFKKTMEDNNSYLFASTYPAFLINDNTIINYAVEQKLTLKSDYSYHYEYSITLKNVNNNDVASIEVDMNGSFTFESTSISSAFYVELNNPTSGTETFYGARITNLTMFDLWSKLNEKSYEIKIEDLLDDPSFSYDKYIKSRKVKVYKSTETALNTVEDVMYFRFILDDLMPYSTILGSR